MTAEAPADRASRGTNVVLLTLAAGQFLLAAAVLVIVSLFDNPIRLVAGLALLGLAVMAGWAALVHRGGRRAVAAAVAVLALIGLVLLLPTGSVLRLAVVVALVAISMVAARVALAKDLRVGTTGRT
jgi:hypothetical protein